MQSSPLARFLDTLAFFTCLVPARMYSGTDMPRCVPWFSAAGLTIGFLTTGLSLLAGFFFRGIVPPLFQALAAGFIWCAAEIIISRALHWDGLSDLADALGSARDGEGFWQVLKDSRVGSFGTLAMVCVFAGQVIACSAHAARGDILALVLAPAASRCLAALPLCYVAPHNPKSLGGRFSGGGTAGTKRLSLCLLAIMLALCAAAGVSAAGLALLVSSCALLLLFIIRTARRQGGIYGDFIGATIEAGQLLVLIFSF